MYLFFPGSAAGAGAGTGGAAAGFGAGAGASSFKGGGFPDPLALLVAGLLVAALGGATTSNLGCAFLGGGGGSDPSFFLTLASPLSWPPLPMPICFLMSILKFKMSPLYLAIVLLSQIQISFATCEMRRMSDGVAK